MRFMICYDGSGQSKIALQLGIRYAHAFKAEILVATALEGDPKEQLNHLSEADKVLTEASKELEDAGVVFDTKMLPANNLSIGENLVLLAEDKQVDKIILGINKTSKVGKFVFGSTAQHVILTSSCPVVTVK